MALLVQEIMNREVYAAAADTPPDEVLSHLLGLGISAAPVVDAQFRPIGVVSIRDLIRRQSRTALEQMSTPASTVRDCATVEEAGARLARTGRRHLVVTDDSGRTCGFISAHDVMCALLGQPIKHPASFPHYDPATQMVWSDPVPMTRRSAGALASAPGLIQLIHGGRGLEEKPVWISAARDIRAEVERLLCHADALPERLRDAKSRGELRVRVASLAPGLPPPTLDTSPTTG